MSNFNMQGFREQILANARLIFKPILNTQGTTDLDVILFRKVTYHSMGPAQYETATYQAVVIRNRSDTITKGEVKPTIKEAYEALLEKVATMATDQRLVRDFLGQEGYDEGVVPLTPFPDESEF